MELYGMGSWATPETVMLSTTEVKKGMDDEAEHVAQKETVVLEPGIEKAEPRCRT